MKLDLKILEPLEIKNRLVKTTLLALVHEEGLEERQSILDAYIEVDRVLTFVQSQIDLGKKEIK